LRASRRAAGNYPAGDEVAAFWIGNACGVVGEVPCAMATAKVSLE
jgi:hypothetical protein